MYVICLPVKAWKSNAQLPKYLKRISYSMRNIYLMVWQQEILKKCKIKKTKQKEGKIKYNPKVLEPLYLDFISKWAQKF